jgi:FkbM family methyltransferase
MQAFMGHDPEGVVTLLYRLLLRREPDPEGLDYHAEALRANRVTPEELARQFAASEEFLGRKLHDHDVVRLSVLDCEFVLPANAAVIHELASPEGYEPWVLPYFLDHCRPGMTVVDVGASWGAFALPAARRVGASGKVFALEVSPRNCQVLLKSIKASGLDNVRILPMGVSDRFGSELLRKQDVTNNNAINTGEDAGVDDLDHYEIVPVAPLDMVRAALGPVHILKMDIEGMEYRASIGALSFLRDQHPLTFIEYSPDFQRQGSGVEGAELLRLFLDLGYDIEILHRHAGRERIAASAKPEVIARVDAAWREHVERDQGTHLDLCLHPKPF